MRTGLAVGQVYELKDGTVAKRRIRVIDVQDGQAVCVYEKYWGRPKMVGLRCMLPDSAAWALVKQEA